MSERRWRVQFCWQTKLFLAPTRWVPSCHTECTRSHTECTQSHTLTNRLRGARCEKRSRARTTFGGAKPITGVGTMTVPNQTLHAKFSPRLEPYGAFRLHLNEISAWLNAGCTVRSVWIEWKQNGAFPGCYRSFLRYCHKHNLPCSGAVEPENPSRDHNHAGGGLLAPHPRLVATNGIQVPRAPSLPEPSSGSKPKAAVSANSARPSKVYPPPVSRPREFIPSEED